MGKLFYFIHAVCIFLNQITLTVREFFRAIARGLRIVAGEHDMRTDSGLEQYRDVESYDMHPRYTASTYEDDIALIYVSSPYCSPDNLYIATGDLFTYFQLTEPLDLSGSEVQPVNLPPPTSEYDPPAGTNVTVSGWGVTRVSEAFLLTFHKIENFFK